MKICFMCDLHLPFDQGAMPYDVLRWAIEDAVKMQTDCIAFAGDITCDGREEVYRTCIRALEETGIPVLYVPGNSDLRCPQSRAILACCASPCKNEFGEVVIYAVNDADGSVSQEQMAQLESADDGSIVFMHHPIDSHDAQTVEWLRAWRESHAGVMLFFGHLHRFFVDGDGVSLQAMDPDKAIGECPCITYYDTESHEVHRAHYSLPVPTDLYGYFGVSCYDPIGHVSFAIQNGLAYLELRPNALFANETALCEAIQAWREAGGIGLSVHLPDIGWDGDAVVEDESLERLLSLTSLLHADRVTQHVPKVAVGAVRQDPEVLEKISARLGARLDALSHDVVVGVENMHMTAAERADDTRRFGYIPEECLAFMESLGRHTRHRVGINFDIGHARNNAPYSQTYQIGTWMSLLGEHVVGYHIHQVKKDGDVFENHVAIDDVYGCLISYASFFGYWSRGRIQHAPVIFEMRPKDAYETTLKTFSRHWDATALDGARS